MPGECPSIYRQAANVEYITELEQLPKDFANDSIVVMNLNHNILRLLDGLQRFSALRELYLSGNRITSMKGIETLRSLEILDLSGNQISKISGLVHLQSLLSLNLENNSLVDLDGIRVLWSRSLFKLKISGNTCFSNEGTIEQMMSNFVGLVSLRELDIDFHIPRYVIFQACKSLELLNGETVTSAERETVLGNHPPVFRVNSSVPEVYKAEISELKAQIDQLLKAKTQNDAVVEKRMVRWKSDLKILETEVAQKEEDRLTKIRTLENQVLILQNALTSAKQEYLLESERICCDNEKQRNTLETQLAVIARMLDESVQTQSKSEELHAKAISEANAKLVESNLSQVENEELHANITLLESRLAQESQTNCQEIETLKNLLAQERQTYEQAIRKAAVLISETRQRQKQQIAKSSSEVLKLHDERLVENERVAHQTETIALLTQETQRLVSKDLKQTEHIALLTQEIQRLALQELKQTENIALLTQETQRLVSKDLKQTENIALLTQEIQRLALQELKRKEKLGLITQENERLTLRELKQKDKIDLLTQENERLTLQVNTFSESAETRIKLKESVIADLSEQLVDLKANIDTWGSELQRVESERDQSRSELEEKAKVLKFVSSEVEGIKNSFDVKLAAAQTGCKAQLKEAANILVTMEARLKEECNNRKIAEKQLQNASDQFAARMNKMHLLIDTG